MTRRGFTAIELLIVLVVVGAVLAIALPKTTEARERLRLDAAAHQLAGDLRRLQVEAIKHNQSGLFQRTGPTTYTLDFIGQRTLSEPVSFADESATQIRLASFGPPVGGGATFVIGSGTRSKAVAVSAAGLVTVQ